MKIITILLSLLFFLSVTPTTDAWYGAGYSEGWPNTIYGATGKIVSPIYKEPALSYLTNEKITINFTLENPDNNTKTISHKIYLKIWKVENVDANSTALDENTLYKNHNEKLDTQSPYRTIPLDELYLNTGENSKSKAEFTITDPGYYQFDITDLDQDTDFIPGHIYAAGFIRVINTPSDAVMGSSNEPTFFNLWKQGLGILLLITTFTTPLLLFAIKKRKQKDTNNIPSRNLVN